MRPKHLLALCAVLALAGCQGESTTPTASADATPIKALSQADLDKMAPEQRKAYEQAQVSMNGDRKMKGQPPLPTSGAGGG